MKTEIPLFTLENGKTFPSGTAFVVELQGKEYVICPRHLVGNGVKVAKVELGGVTTGPCLNEEVEDLDIMVFEVLSNTGMTPLKLAEGVTGYDTPLTALPSNLKGFASNRGDEVMVGRLETPIPDGSSGSAIVNEAGEVVSMFIGARANDRVTICGMASPLIRKILLSL